ncbi:MAG: alginate lyase family protein [Bacteroidales bacterium]|nr:alginate lyase family protein [Bacteroidales bacterium]
MKNRFLLLLALAVCACSPRSGDDVFSLLNRKETGGARTPEELLAHFRARDYSAIPGWPKELHATARDMRIADEALEHILFVHDSYQPSYFYGKDIDWQYWPVKDNELRWQLHRQKWFTPMGLAYKETGDEKYAREWVLQYRDWIAKNPNGGPAWQQPGGVVSAGEIALDAPNWEFAWRPLEVSSRLDAQPNQFRLFLNSPSFTPEFLMEFLSNYHEHLSFLSKNIAPEGNHRLFEAFSILRGTIFFPEFKESKRWYREALKILRDELDIQIYPDGVQSELDPAYHMSMAKLYASVLDVVPDPAIREKLHAMVEFTLGITYPDYTYPCFGDCRVASKGSFLGFIKIWQKAFPDDEHIRWFATEGREGSPWSWKAKAWHDAGFYLFRTGWGPDDTVVAIKAGKAGAWHAQPDYGTFEIWHAGRNLSPDSGSFIYAGDEEVMRQRNWFRQTRVHNALTLDNENVATADCRELSFTDSTLVFEHADYEGLTHRRSYIWRGSSLELLDEAFGPAEGTVGIHFHFAPGELRLGGDVAEGPGLRVQCSSALPGQFHGEEGWYSQIYRKKTERPSAVYEVQKSASDTVRVRSVLSF